MINKFLYAKGVSKRDLLIAADRINGFKIGDESTIKLQFNNLSGDNDDVQGSVQINFPDNKAKEFLEETLKSLSRKPFTVLANDISLEATSSLYDGTAVTIDDPID